MAGRLPEPLRERLVEALAALLVSDMERYPDLDAEDREALENFTAREADR